jgi:hypothetical protein
MSKEFQFDYPVSGKELPKDLKELCDFICEVNEELAKTPLEK